MIFEENVEAIFAMNKKAHAVILSCNKLEHLEGAHNYVANLERFFRTIKCNQQISKGYLAKSLSNIKTILKIQKRKLKS